MRTTWLGNLVFEKDDIVFYGNRKCIVISTSKVSRLGSHTLNIRSLKGFLEAEIPSGVVKPVIRTRKCLKHIRTWEGLLNKLNERDYFDD